MKFNIAFVLVCSFFLQSLKAADLLVEEFGVSPAYSSVNAAISAASDGDRIFIRSRTGNIPWVEEITIAKSLELLPFENDTFFYFQGNITITSANNRKVTIIGIYNTQGTLTASAGNTAARTQVNILGSHFQNGGINLNFNGVKATVAHTYVNNSGISLRYGGVYGCEVVNSSSSTAITVTAEMSPPAAEFVYIIGNRTHTSWSGTGHGIRWNSNTHYFDIRNNLVYSGGDGITVSTSMGNPAEINKVYNNTVSLIGSISTSQYGINVSATGAGGIVEIMNNLIHRGNNFNGNSAYGIRSSSSNAQTNAYYNYIHNNFSGTNSHISGTFTVSTPNSAGALSLTSDGNISGSGGVDAGNPSNVFFDLNLTRNDCGAYGGSYSLANYRPLHYGSSRVFFVKYPFNIRQGTTLSIEADGYDR